MTSAGFGGLAAVIAAGIAISGVKKTLQHARERDEYSEKRDAEASWWDRLEWVTESALSKGSNGSNVPPQVALSSLRALRKAASSDIQVTACDGVHGYFELLHRSTHTAAPSPSNVNNFDARQPDSARTLDTDKTELPGSSETPLETVMRIHQGVESGFERALSDYAKEAVEDFRIKVLEDLLDPGTSAVPKFVQRSARVDAVSGGQEAFYVITAWWVEDSTVAHSNAISNIDLLIHLLKKEYPGAKIMIFVPYELKEGTSMISEVPVFVWPPRPDPNGAPRKFFSHYLSNG